MGNITPKEASEILSHYTDLGYGIIIEGDDISKIKQALFLARKTVANGTPITGGDCISREALKKAMWSLVINENDDIPVLNAIETIDNAQAVDLWQMRQEATENALKKAEVLYGRPKGEWKTVEGIDGDEYYECSNCGEPWVLTAGTPKDNNMNFCPNCGAKMKGGAE